MYFAQENMLWKETYLQNKYMVSYYLICIQIFLVNMKFVFGI